MNEQLKQLVETIDAEINNNPEKAIIATVCYTPRPFDDETSADAGTGTDAAPEPDELEPTDAGTEPTGPRPFPLFQSLDGAPAGIVHALPDCPHCFHETPSLIGYHRIKQRSPGTDRKHYKIARLYHCPKCGLRFVTGEEIPTDFAPRPFYAPVGYWKEQAIREQFTKRNEQLNRMQSKWGAVVTRKLPRAGIFPSLDGSLRIAFVSVGEAIEWINAIGDAVSNCQRKKPTAAGTEPTESASVSAQEGGAK